MYDGPREPKTLHFLVGHLCCVINILLSKSAGRTLLKDSLKKCAMELAEVCEPCLAVNSRKLCQDYSQQ